MKRVLLVTVDFAPKTGGVARYYRHIIGGIDPTDVFVLTDVYPESQEFDRRQKYHIYRRRFFARWPIWPKWLFLFWHVFVLVRRHKIECILVGEVLPTGLVIVVLARWLKIPYFVFTHGLDIRLVRRSKRKFRLARFVFHDARGVMGNSQFTASELKTFDIPTEKVTVITPGFQPFSSVPTAVEQEVFRSHVGLLDKRCLLSVGRLVERKGFDTVIAALPAILNRFPDTLYVIVGSGPDSHRLRTEVEKRSLQNHVRFIEGASDGDVALWYSICDMFIMVPRSLADGDVEGFGIVYLEAASFAKPVIGSYSGGVTEAVVPGLTGLIIDPADSLQLQKAVFRLFDDSSLARELGQNGKRRVEQSFSWILRQKQLIQRMESPL